MGGCFMEDGKNRKESESTEKDYMDRIRKLEERIEELEKEKANEEKIEIEEPSIVGDVVSQFIPGLGGIIKSLEKASPEFKQRIAETDAEVKHRIEMGWESKPQVEYGFSMKPLGTGLGKSGHRRAAAKPRTMAVKMPEKAPEKEPIIDVFETGNHISVIAELPGFREDDIETKLVENTLEISAGSHTKSIELPSTPKSIVDKTYRHGVLQLKIEKGS
jgi:HSP20 family protein